ncbi:Polypyrimidine tract-binding protein [Apis cerana cerana]|uniref:Polypyrimidine tract-binding protein n=1 Tax=Apis cerana cerana TaxID=94128 RepID=A0A2A3E657_APICC|nr:Polypyrimidine tract-binding protein [Apis cerana cerana]
MYCSIWLAEDVVLLYDKCNERGSDELLSQSGAVSNGAAMSPQPHHAADNNNDAKKAFLEMADENAAATMVNYYASCMAQLRGRAVYVQFSNHRELKTDQTHTNNANSNNQVALPGQNQVAQTQAETQGGPNTVLRVIVEQMVYPISLDVLYQSLEGQNIYNSCCTLRIDYSKMQNLNVKYNNDKSRDYTNPSLPTGDANLDAASLALGGELLPQLLMGAGSQPRARIPESIAGAPGVLPTPFAAMHGLPSPLAGPYNGVPPAGGLAGLGGFPLGAAGLGVRVPTNAQTSAVLLVSVYGDVQRVKILYNKKDSALIQMAEPHQAHLALTHMDKLRVFGKQIKVMLSKHQTVQLPKEGQPDAGLTKDYTNSPLHRFKKPGSKNYQNIYPPSSTLHLSNIPTTVTEEEIRDAFTKNGFTVKAFKFFPKDRKMALIQMPSMDDAVAALIKCIRLIVFKSDPYSKSLLYPIFLLYRTNKNCSSIAENAQLPVKRVQSPQSVILEEQHLTRVTIKQPAETAINEKGTQGDPKF